MDYSNLKKNLQALADKKRKEKAEEDKKRTAKNEEDRNLMLTSMSKDFGEVFKPYLEQIKEHSNLSSKELSRIIAESVQVNVPELDTQSIAAAIEGSIAKAMGSLRFPTPQSTVNVPEIKIPAIQMPDQMDIKGWIGMMGYDKGLLQNPFPVQIRDANGKPVDLSNRGATQVLGGGGGKMDFFTIKDIMKTVGVVTINPDGTPVYSGGSSGGGVTDAELRAAHLDVQQLSGSMDSVAVKEIFGSAIVSLLNGDNRIPVSVETGGSGLTDAELRATALQIIQLSGSAFSVNVIGAVNTSVALTNSDGATIDPRDRNWSITEVLSILQASGAVDSVIVNAFLTSLETKQVSGSIDSVYITGAAGTIAAVPTNPAGLSADIPSGTYGNGQLMYRPHDAGAFSDAYANNPQNYVDENYNQIIQGVFPFVFNGTTWDRIRGNATDGIRMSQSQVSGAVDSSSVILAGSAAAAKDDTFYGDGVTSGILTAALRLFNGADYDRLHSNAGDSAGAMRTVQAVDSVSSINMIQVNGSTPTLLAIGAGETNANTLRVIHAADAAASVFVSGFADSATVYEARRTNPTAVADGADVRPRTDDLGRQVMRPVQVRDLTLTARVTVSNGTETTLRAAVAGAFLDMIYLSFSNNSTAAVTVDIRDATAGNIVHTLTLPPSSAGPNAEWYPSVPYPQGNQGNNWTIDLPDITGTTVSVSGMFSQEV